MQNISMSIGGFLEAAKKFLDVDDRESFVKLMLNGILEGSQATIETSYNRIQPNNNHQISILRNYDSLFGIDEEIRVEGNITLLPQVPSGCNSLFDKDVHFKYSFQDSGGRTVKAEPHRIPNVRIAQWKTQNEIYILFPGLYLDRTQTYGLEAPSTPAEERLDEFYEKGLHPTIVELLGETATNQLSLTYKREAVPSTPPLPLPGPNVLQFGQTLRRNLAANGVHWAKDLAFLHVVSGDKNFPLHKRTPEEATLALATFSAANLIPTEVLAGRNWYIDVGLEIQSSLGVCLAWGTDDHTSVTFGAVQGITKQTAAAIATLDNRCYTRDMMVSHPTAVSGCRIRLGPHGGTLRARYLKMSWKYKEALTDQASTPASLAAAEEIIERHNNGIPEIHDPGALYFGLYNLFLASVETIQTCANIQLRVPATCAAIALMNFEEDELRLSLYAFSRQDWWLLSAYQALALDYLSSQWRLSVSGKGLKKNTLLLSIAQVTLANALQAPINTHSSAFRDVLKAILPVTGTNPREGGRLLYARTRSVFDEVGFVRPEGQMLPWAEHGLIFLREVVLGNQGSIPRFANDGRPFLDQNTFYHLFKCTYDEMRRRSY